MTIQEFPVEIGLRCKEVAMSGEYADVYLNVQLYKIVYFNEILAHVQLALCGGGISMAIYNCLYVQYMHACLHVMI